MKNTLTLSRRSFIRKMGWASAGITAVSLTGCSLPPLPYRGNPTASEAVFWLSLRETGEVEFISPRTEMGQGIAAGLRLVVAEGLGIDPDIITYIHPRSDRSFPVKATVGSESVMHYAPIISSLAHTMRGALLKRISEQEGREVVDFRIHGTEIEIEKVRKPLAVYLTPPLFVDENDIADVPFNIEQTNRYLGKRYVEPEIKDVVKASSPVFVDDVYLPKMLVARKLPPAFSEMTIEELGQHLPDYLKKEVELVLEEKTFFLVSERRAAIEKAMEKLGVLDQSSEAEGTSTDYLAGKLSNLEHSLVDEGSVKARDYDLDLEFQVSAAAHAPMEPRAAVAKYEAEKVEIWTANQDITLTRKYMVKALEMDEDEILIHQMRMGGGFGGKVFSEIETEAARLSRRFGRPVKLQWTREDEFRYGYHRPPSRHRIRASLDADGKIEKWVHGFKSGHVIFSSAFLPTWIQSFTDLVSDKGVARGAVPAYRFKNASIEFEDVRFPLPTGPWRGLGALPNNWAIETAINTLADKTGQDPVEFRLKHIPSEHQRLADVTSRVASMAGWDKKQENSKIAYGIACGIYKEMSYSATIAKVEKISDGGFKILKLWTVHDCGFVLHPEGVTAQIEGNLMWCIGSVFYEKLNWGSDRVYTENFDDYIWAGFADVPSMDIEMMGFENAPTGAGETAIVSGTAAITHAISKLTGAVVTKLPIAS
ncbi:MAG: molybdopterin-dependent oxidoreductase [Sneathiellales bacterium]|nr:molybdopterin-dependent oxidoreductase [Sneathiellales bacterium]